MILIILMLTICDFVVIIALSEITNSEGLEFVNPIWLHAKYKVNWFGAGCLTLLFNTLALPYAICYWWYKLCTVGRK